MFSAAKRILAAPEASRTHTIWQTRPLSVSGTSLTHAMQAKQDTNAEKVVGKSAFRRLVTGRDPSELSRVLTRLGSRDSCMRILNGYTDNAGKTLLHHAAWRGCAESVRLLVAAGMNVNAVATGPHCAGKTPIFFALTRGQDRNVCALLELGASVRIVNNKGQTPLSLAATHVQQATVNLIASREALEDSAWRNYRATHSDGQVYGDLDPRFLHCLQPEDTVEALVVNPTTRETREERRRARQAACHPPSTQAFGRHGGPEVSPTPVKQTASRPHDLQQLGEESMTAGKVRELFGNIIASLDSKKAPYVAFLVSVVEEQIAKRPPCRQLLVTIACQPAAEGATREQRRIDRILKKVLTRALGLPHACRGGQSNHSGETEATKLPLGGQPAPAVLRVGKDKPRSASLLAPLKMEDGTRTTWVDTADGVTDMWRVLLGMVAAVEEEGAFLPIGVDTEWVTSSSHGTTLALIQLAAGSHTWCCDAIAEPEALQNLRTRLGEIFAHSGVVVVGFALQADMKLLATFGCPISTKIEDLQRTALSRGIGSKGSLPGLRCVCPGLNLRLCCPPLSLIANHRLLASEIAVA